MSSLIIDDVLEDEQKISVAISQSNEDTYEPLKIMTNSVEKSSEKVLLSAITDDNTDETIEGPKSNDGSTTVFEENYGYIKDENRRKINVTKYTLLNKNKMFIEIINYGATVISCWVPNKQGVFEDVILGFDSIEDYRSRNTYSIGSTLGRVTDYISDGNFKNDKGEIVKLNKNLGNHHFNGGIKGFDKVMWDGHVADDKLVLSYSSKDGEEGYPGTFQAQIIFCLTCKNELVIDYIGMTSKLTPVNISTNMFFNLAGHNAGETEIENHSVMINANEYVVVRMPERRPIGLIKNVQHTCLDLRVPRLLKTAFPLVPGFGYNHTFKLFKGSEHKAFNLAASLMHKSSGRILDVYTDMPCIYANTAQDFPSYGKISFKEEVLKVTDIASPMARFGGNENKLESSSISDEYNFMSNHELIMSENEEEGEHFLKKPLKQVNVHITQDSWPIIGKSKTVYRKHSGICIRPQLFPDAVSHKNFKNTILKPSNLYSQQTIYKFGVVSSN